MKFASSIFDRIRVKPDEDQRVRIDCPTCDWPSCTEAATHRAPKGRLREGQYWRFCLGHVREYNHSYNYFAGMSDEAVARFQKDSLTGHRPTWKMGLAGGPKGKKGDRDDMFGGPGGTTDPFGFFREMGGSGRAQPDPEKAPEGRMVRNAERKALETLGLDIDATTQEIKARFKELVKRHHPDANGGDRSTEERLREIIQAYNYLKRSGHR